MKSCTIAAIMASTVALAPVTAAAEAAHSSAHMAVNTIESESNMPALEDAVRKEVEDLHQFFVEWFSGATARETLDTYFAPRMHKDMHIIAPSGNMMDRKTLLEVFQTIYGNNPDVRIAVRNVRILHESDAHILVAYEEWQKVGADAQSGTGRLSTALMTKTAPFEWVHVHETWLPEDIQKAGPYDF